MTLWNRLRWALLGGLVMDMIAWAAMKLWDRRTQIEPPPAAAVVLNTVVSSKEDFFETIFFPEAKEPCRYYYNNGVCSRADCNFLHEAILLEKLLCSINKCKRTMDICVYHISSPELINAILRVHKRGACVRIVTDGNGPDDAAVRHEAFRRNGIAIRTNAPGFLMHHKFVVVDSTVLINGSFNWSWNAITENHENLLITDNHDLVSTYLAEFNKLWDAFVPPLLKKMEPINQEPLTTGETA